VKITEIHGKMLYQSRAGSIREALEEAVRSGADLRGSDLRNADLRGADLRNADLCDASLSGAFGADLADANLIGASLAGTNLTGASLAGTNLTGALRTPWWCVTRIRGSRHLIQWVDGEGLLPRQIVEYKSYIDFYLSQYDTQGGSDENTD